MAPIDRRALFRSNFLERTARRRHQGCGRCLFVPLALGKAPPAPIMTNGRPSERLACPMQVLAFGAAAAKW